VWYEGLLSSANAIRSSFLPGALLKIKVGLLLGGVENFFLMIEAISCYYLDVYKCSTRVYIYALGRPKASYPPIWSYPAWPRGRAR
jgi:hypothetical protein